MDIVWFGQQEWSRTWTSKQQLSTRLARRGHRVLYVDPHAQARPAPVLPALRSVLVGDDRLHLRRTGPNGLTVFSYRHLPPLRWRGNQWWRRRALRRVLDRMAMRDPLAVVMTPTARERVEELDPWSTVYYAVDEWTSFSWSDEERRRVRADEEALLGRSDAALGVSPRLVERFRTIQPNSHLLDNAADIDHFSPGTLERAPELPELSAIHGPKLGFLGQVDDRFDQELMATLADRHPEWQVVIVGRVMSGLDVRRLEARPNIHFIPFKQFHELPSVLKHFDVCTIPYRPIERSHACSPYKAFEYLATGKPVIATPLRTYATVGHALRLAEGAEAWEEAVGEALADPADGVSLRLECARRNGWEDRVDRLEALLEEVRLQALREGRGPRVPIESPRRPLRQGAVAAFCGRIPTADDPDVGEPSLRYRIMLRLTLLVGAARRLATGRGSHAPRILFARRAWLGDLLVAIPALRRLRQVFPDAHVTLGVQDGAPGLDILRSEGLIDDTVVLEFLSEERLRDRLSGAWAFLRSGWDITLCGSRRMMLREAFLSGARSRIGLWDGSQWQRFNSVVLPRDNTHHEMESNLLLVDALALMEGRASGSERTGAMLPVLRPPDAPVDRLLHDVGIPADAPLLVMHPGSKRTTRRWPSDRFARVAARILEARPELHVVWTGTESERDWHEQLRQELPEELKARAPSVAGHTSLPMLFALLRRARVVVSNDTGVMHAARASGAPLVALLGPGEARRWSPAPVGAAPAVALRAVVPCAPCLKDECGSHFCMRSLPEDIVLEEVERILQDEAANGDHHAVRWRISNLSWGTLDEAGFRLPTVRAPRFGSGETCSIQRYPALTWEPLSRDDDPGRSHGWATLVREPVPDFVALGARPSEWRPEALELATAALFREPEHHAVVGIAAERRGAVPGYEGSRQWGSELFDTGLVLARASAFRRFLERVGHLPPPDKRGMAELTGRLVRDPMIRVVLLDEPLTGPR